MEPMSLAPASLAPTSLAPAPKMRARSISVVKKPGNLPCKPRRPNSFQIPGTHRLGAEQGPWDCNLNTLPSTVTGRHQSVDTPWKYQVARILHYPS